MGHVHADLCQPTSLEGLVRPPNVRFVWGILRNQLHDILLTKSNAQSGESGTTSLVWFLHRLLDIKGISLPEYVALCPILLVNEKLGLVWPVHSGSEA